MNPVIKSVLKQTKASMLMRYKYYSRTQAFKKRYKNIDGSLFNNTLDKEIIESYKDIWGVFGLEVEVDTFLLCYNISGKLDYNIVPENIFAAVIEPSLNKYKNKELSFISIKNIYEKWFDCKDVFPKSYLHKIDNIFYDNQFNVIKNIDEFLNVELFKYPLICKPSIGTAGGLGIKTVNNLNEIKESLNAYENLVYQEKIIQNKLIDRINPGISSVRTCLYRTRSGKFKVLNNSIRFGVAGSLDNETAGGLVCNIGNNGYLNTYAVKKYCEKHKIHPDSKVSFSDIIIPFYDNLFQVAEMIANEIPLCNLVSLDMCLDINNNWRCIEINLREQTIRFAQYAGVGFFGDYTDEVIKGVLNESSHSSP